MKRFIINFSLVMIAFVIYFLQENFFDWFTIAGVMPNLFIIFILFIGLFSGRNKGTIYGLVIGLMLDILIGNRMGIYTITLGLLAGKNPIKENLDASSPDNIRAGTNAVAPGITVYSK